MSEKPADFHQLRRTGIGGSDASAALGLSPWQTPYDLWLEKTGEAEPVTANERMHWGTLLEPVIAAEYTRRTGRVLEPPGAMLRHARHQWMIGHIDGKVRGEPRLVEFKTAGTARGWGESGSDEVPLAYSVQVHHYLTLTGCQVADLVVLIGGSDFRVFEILHDPDISRDLIEAEEVFWRHVEDREPPDPVSASDAVKRWGRFAVAGAVTAPVEVAQAIDELRSIHDQRALLDDAEESAKLIVMEAFGERGDSLVDAAGGILATWKLDRGRKAYTVEAREPSRRFLLKG
jgi:putative phage-type endonuclease